MIIPNVKKFTKNTQAVRVMKSAWKGPAKGNGRGGVQDNDKENFDEPLPKRS